MMKNLTLIVFVLLLLFAVPAVAQDEDTEVAPAAEVEDAEDTAVDLMLPDWASTLTFGALSASLLVSAATEVTKRVLQVIGLYRDGWGRGIMAVWAFGFVALALASNLFDISAVVDSRVEWLYQVMLLLLTLLGAPTAYTWAKKTGLAPTND